MADEEVISTELLTVTFRSLRQEIGEVRRLALGLGEGMRGIERRIIGVEQRMIGVEQRLDALKDDLETMFKMEIVGFRAANEASLDARFAELLHALKK